MLNIRNSLIYYKTWKLINGNTPTCAEDGNEKQRVRAEINLWIQKPLNSLTPTFYWYENKNLKSDYASSDRLTLIKTKRTSYRFSVASCQDSCPNVRDLARCGHIHFSHVMVTQQIWYNYRSAQGKKTKKEQSSKWETQNSGLC